MMTEKRPFSACSSAHCALILASLALAAAGSAGAVALQRGGDLGTATTGDHLYVGQGATVVTLASDALEPPQIVDVTAPLPGLVRGLAIRDDVLFATWRTGHPSGQLALFSLTDPAQPTWLANIPYADNSILQPGGLTIVDTTLFLVDGEIGLIPIDVSNPHEPVVGTPVTRFNLRGVASLDATHLVAWGRSFLGQLVLSIFDVSTPSSPILVGTYGGGNQFDVAVGDGYIVLTGQGFQVVDLSEPTNPSLLASVPEANGFTGTIVDGHLLLGWEGAIRVWDLSDPSNPAERPSVPAPADRTRLFAASPVGGETFMLSDKARALTLDTTIASLPEVKHVLDLPVGVDPTDVASVGSTVLISDFYTGLRTAGSALESLGRLEPPSPLPAFEGVAVDGSLALLADWSFGVHTVDVSNPEAPVALGSVPFTFASAVDVDGTRAWAVSSTNGGFFVSVDLSDPSAPQITSSTPIGQGRDVHFDSDHVYIADGDLRIYDVSGSSPVQVAQYMDCNSALGVDVQAGLAAVACTNGELHLVDVSVPDSPVQLGVYTDSSVFMQGSAALIDGEHAFFGYSSGLDIVDISDPTNPSLIDRPDIPGGVRGLTHAPDGGAWVAAGTGGIALVPPPAADDITLTAVGRKVRGMHTVDLSWQGATSEEIDVFRDGVVIATVPNDGSYTDSIGRRGRAIYTHQICEAGTSSCSNETTVRFGQ